VIYTYSRYNIFDSNKYREDEAPFSMAIRID